jgi:hypothetical protein
MTLLLSDERGGKRAEQSTDWQAAAKNSLANHTVFFNGLGDITGMAAGVELAFTIRISDRHLKCLLAKSIEPRSLLVFGDVTVGGSVAEALAFLDHLAGQSSTPLPRVDRPPEPTLDIGQAKRDFVEFGYCLVKDALDARQLLALRTRLTQQAAGEAQAGCGVFEGPISGFGASPIREPSSSRCSIIL